MYTMHYSRHPYNSPAPPFAFVGGALLLTPYHHQHQAPRKQYHLRTEQHKHQRCKKTSWTTGDGITTSTFYHTRPWSTYSQPCPVRYAKLIMMASTPSINNTNNNNNNNDNTSDKNQINKNSSSHSTNNSQDESQSNSNLPTNADVNNTDDENMTNISPPTTEFRFSQEVLRRRMAALNESIQQKQQQNPNYTPNASDNVLDLSIVTDSHFISPTSSTSQSSSTSDDEIDIQHESMTDTEARQFIESFDKLARVWVILFTNARDGTEGIYSLSVGNDNIVLAFQERYEAQRYGVCLEAQKFPQAQICEMAPKNIKDFCHGAGLKLGFIPTGMAITPPEESAIDDLDKWRGTPADENSGMTEEDIDAMRKRFDTLFGQ